MVLGYEDPLVDEITRDSPTMSKLSLMLILQLAASKESTIELREKLKLRPNEVLHAQRVLRPS